MTDLPPIVGIGASAGGLDALKAFVAALPEDGGLAYIVVQHLAPGHPSMLDRILRQHTALPVERIETQAAIEPDRIYVIPPGPALEIADGRLVLIDRTPEEGPRRPIDRFFSSLAEAAGRQAFAVVLSGSGADGTLGVRAVKTRGGIALAQESHSAEFSGMPDSAIATGLVDFVLRPADMPRRILDIVAHRRALDERVGRDALMRETEDRLPEILAILAEAGDGAFDAYKTGTLVRRVTRRMALSRHASVERYLQTLRDTGEERRALAQDFMIGVTQFFRDPEIHEKVKDRVLRPLMARDTPDFRLWVPGCSTGEEVFSLAILVAELKRDCGDTRSWKIFGTDIDLQALRTARAGLFSDAALKGMDSARRDAHFVRNDGEWRADTTLRDMCVFASHNLLQDPPFSRLDLISCRNVMIYLGADAQEALLPRFHYALNPGGFLWLGPSESLGRAERYFRTIDRSARLFERDDTVRPQFSALGPSPASRLVKRASTRPPEPGRLGPSRPDRTVAARSERAYLDRFAPPFATVNRQNEIVYISEAMTELVRPSRGVPSTQLDDFLTMDLRLPVHGALEEARRTGQTAETPDVALTTATGTRVFDVTATPIDGEGDLVLVGLVEVRHRGGAGDPAVPRDRDHGPELLLTRKRLAALQREYESADQEVRSANEELLSMNEELQSSNEELETSREELQSINEELETINAELTDNNQQLVRANSDLKNLLESTDIATLFLDEFDRVRLFTPELARLIGVQERDIGRSIHDLAFRIRYPDLRKDAETVRRTLRSVERETRIDDTDETFSTWVRPYRTVENRLDGVVITFVDVTTRTRAERRLRENARLLREQYAELEQLYDNAPVGLTLLDRDLRYLRINARLAEINGHTVADHIGRHQSEIVPDASAKIEQMQRRVFETGEPVIGLSVRTETRAEPGRLREFVVDYYPVRDGDTVFAIGACVREVTHERALQRQVEESETRLRSILDRAPLAVTIHEGETLVTTFSNRRNQEEVNGRQLVGRPMIEAIPELEGHPLETGMKHVLRTGETVVSEDLPAALPYGNPNGPRIASRNVLEPWVDATGARVGVISFSVDISEQLLARRRDAALRERLQRLLNGLPALVGLIDPGGTLREVNAEALARGGLDRAEVIGRPFWECGWWPVDAQTQETLRAAVARAAQGQTVRYDAVIHTVENDRTIVDFQMVPILDASGQVDDIVASGIDITDRVHAEDRKALLVAELEHRVKNTLAVIVAITRFTARMSKGKEEMATSLIERIHAIARTHDALTAQDWAGQNLRALVSSEVAPFADAEGRRCSFSGDDVFLEPNAALSVGLALHELATNAAKYGALSVPSGRVEVIAKAGPGGLYRLEWNESGGPPVEAPSRSGFGSYLVKTMLEKDLAAEVVMDYAAAGFRCTILCRPADRA